MWRIVRYLAKTILLTAIGLLVVPAISADDEVVDLLQGYEWQLPEEKLRHIGPDVYKPLLAIADDERQVNFIRARASLALTAFPNDEVLEYFEREISLGKNNLRRRQMVQDFCTAFLQLKPANIESTLIPMLKEPDARLRSNSARCLQNIDSDKSKGALASYGATISESWEARAAGFKTETGM
ncbi:MAG: hypothetical protein CMQ19_09805 [Gammaproteobacteria bacterium]|nr:hypothetical protein [Gammaproteobacteria bacterium]